LDEVFGLSNIPYKMTVGTMLEIAKESTRCESYEEAEKILKERTSININDDTMRQVTNTVGTIVFNNDTKAAESVWERFNTANLTFNKTKVKGTLFLEVDGAMLPIRQEGQKGIVYKENKLGMAFSTDNIYRWKDKHGKSQHKILKREYTSLIGDSKEFSKFMLLLAVENGYGTFQNTVIISDGASWIRNMKDLLFPDAQQILDYYHLKEHITDYFKIIYNNDENKYHEKSKFISDLFYNSETTKAIKLLKEMSIKKYIDQLDGLLQYIDNNKDNIDYAKYRSLGFFIGSGAIESSNKTVVQRRLKYGAMRWNVSSAQAVVTLVAKTRSGLWPSVVNAVNHHYDQPNFGSWKELNKIFEIS
jgi:hypothetical protein